MWEEATSISDTEKCPITTSFENLFSILNTWDPHGGLTLDISIYSPSDSKHWFQYLTFMPDPPLDMLGTGSYGREKAISISNKDYHDPQHGWVAGSRQSAPPERAIRKVFHSVMEEGPFDSEQLELQWWDQLPPVPAVTSLLLRQQNRRRWMPRSLAHMFARFPRLEEIHYEPWREWDWLQRQTDPSEHPIAAPSSCSCSCSYLVANPRYLGYQYLFKSIQRSNNNLKRLVVFENFNQQYPVTMQRFQYGEDLVKCDNFCNLAPAVSQAVIVWRGTWKLTIEPSIIQSWEVAMHQYDGRRLDVVQEWVDEAAIKSHGDAVHHLMLSSQVIRPISLQQIRVEQEALEGAGTVPL